MSLARELLQWLDTRPMTSLETLVVELREKLKEEVAKEESAEHSETSAITWVCTRCNREPGGNSRFCPHCGNTVYRVKGPLR
jgi:rubrerythrin